MSKSAKQGRRSGRPKQPTSEPSKAKWTPSENERAALDRFFARAKETADVTPRIKVSTGDDATRILLDHPNEIMGTRLLAEAFGTTSLSVTTGLMEQLVDVSLHKGKYNEDRTNFMASVIASIKPRDELEAMLAAQMAAVHLAAMTFARRLASVENLPQQDSAERAFNKLTRTFTTQLEALKRYRSGGEQKVTVQHIDVRGGQAIVGDVSQAGRPAASPVFEEPPPALTDAKQAPMPILMEPVRAVVPAKRK